MVVARSPRGEFAIMEDHAPLLAVLDPGAVRIHTAEATQVYACQRGTLRTIGGRITLLVESAIPVDEIDLSDLDRRIASLAETEGPSRDDERDRLTRLRAIEERYG